MPDRPDSALLTVEAIEAARKRLVQHGPVSMHEVQEAFVRFLATEGREAIVRQVERALWQRDDEERRAEAEEVVSALLGTCDPDTAPTPHPAARLTDRATGEVRTPDIRPLSGATSAAPLGADAGGGGDPSAAARLSNHQGYRQAPALPEGGGDPA